MFTKSGKLKAIILIGSFTSFNNLYAGSVESDEASQTASANYDFGVPRKSPRKPKLKDAERAPASTERASQKDSPAEPHALPEKGSEAEVEEDSNLTGNWGGARKSLDDRGIELGIVYKGEINRVLSGGVRKKSEYLGNLDLRLGLDLEKLGAWHGASAFFYVLGNHGGDPSLNVGDAQGTSNIETSASTVKLYEAWFQQLMAEDKMSMLIGLHDLNSEFYSTDASGLFLNSSFGVGKELSLTGQNGPSIFPTTSAAVRLRAEPTQNSYIQAAVFHAVAGNPDEPYGTHVRLQGSDGTLFISEFAIKPVQTDSPSDPTGKYGMGYWTYSKAVDHLTATNLDASGNSVAVKETNRGWYLLGDQPIGKSLSVFLRYGKAASEVNQVDTCLATGINIRGLIPSRDDDRFGVGLTRVTQGAEYKDTLIAAGSPIVEWETALEFTYRMELMAGFAVQPDYQIITHPGFDPNLPNAHVGAIRFEINF